MQEGKGERVRLLVSLANGRTARSLPLSPTNMDDFQKWKVGERDGSEGPAARLHDEERR